MSERHTNLEKFLEKRKQKDLMEEILSGLRIQEGTESYQFLTGSGSMEHAGRGQLAFIRNVPSMAKIEQSIDDYYSTCGVDDFLCRLVAAHFAKDSYYFYWRFFGRVYANPTFPIELIRGLLERHYPLFDLVAIYQEIHEGWMDWETERWQKFQEEVVELLGKAECLEDLADIAQRGEVIARELSRPWRRLWRW